MFWFLQAITDVDMARECLEKNPDERTEDDIEVLLEFLQNLPVSSNHHLILALLDYSCYILR